MRLVANGRRVRPQQADGLNGRGTIFNKRSSGGPLLLIFVILAGAGVLAAATLALAGVLALATVVAGAAAALTLARIHTFAIVLGGLGLLALLRGLICRWGSGVLRESSAGGQTCDSRA